MDNSQSCAWYVFFMGRRQRLSQFVGVSDAEVLALIADSRTPPDVRQAAVCEAKFRKLRNVRKRRRG